MKFTEEQKRILEADGWEFDTDMDAGDFATKSCIGFTCEVFTVGNATPTPSWCVAMDTPEEYMAIPQKSLEAAMKSANTLMEGYPIV